MGAKENLRHIRNFVTVAGVSLFVVSASPKDTKGIDSIRLSSNTSFGPTPDMVAVRSNPDDHLTPTAVPVPTIGSTPIGKPTETTGLGGSEPGATGEPSEVTITISPPKESTPVLEIVERLNTEWAERLLYLTNNLRNDRGLPPYNPDDRLRAAAEKYAEYWYENGDPYHPDHELDGNWVYRALREGYIGNVTENMGSSFHSPEELFAKWVASPGHFGNLISTDYSDIGIGCFQGVYYYEGRPYKIVECVQDFGEEAWLSTPAPTTEPTPAPLPTATVGPTPTPTPTPTATPTPEPAP